MKQEKEEKPIRVGTFVKMLYKGIYYDCMVLEITSPQRFTGYMLKEDGHGLGFREPNLDLTKTDDMDMDTGLKKWSGKVNNLTVMDIYKYPCLYSLV